MTPSAPAWETTCGWKPDSIHATARARAGSTPLADAIRVIMSRTLEGGAASGGGVAAGRRSFMPTRIGRAGSSLFACASFATVVPLRPAIAASESPGRTV
jgi:hypothetical protein